MEVDVPDREQVDCEREKVEARDKEEGRQNKDQHRTLKHVTSWITCRWSECAPETLEPRCEFDHTCMVHEKNHV